MRGRGLCVKLRREQGQMMSDLIREHDGTCGPESDPIT